MSVTGAEICRQFARVVISATHDLAENDLVFERCIDRAEHWDLQTSDDEICKPIAASNTVSIAGLVVVGIDRIDQLHALWKRRRHREGQCAADRLADDRDVREIELLDKANDRLPEVGFVEARARIY